MKYYASRLWISLLSAIVSRSEVKNIFLNEKPVMALVSISEASGDTYVNQVAKEIDTTYGHTVKIVKMLERKNLINKKKNGRRKNLETTESGEICADHFSSLLEHFGTHKMNSRSFGGVIQD